MKNTITAIRSQKKGSTSCPAKIVLIDLTITNTAAGMNIKMTNNLPEREANDRGMYFLE
jgi:hypothetical protein